MNRRIFQWLLNIGNEIDTEFIDGDDSFNSDTKENVEQNHNVSQSIPTLSLFAESILVDIFRLYFGQDNLDFECIKSASSTAKINGIKFKFPSPGTLVFTTYEKYDMVSEERFSSPLKLLKVLVSIFHCLIK